MEYLLKASALTAIFYILYKVFLQKETFFESNRWFLLTGLIVSFIIPLIVIPVYITKTIEPINNITFAESSTLVPESEPFNYLQIVSVLYVIGVLFFTIRFLIQFFSLFQLIVKSPKEYSNSYTFIKTNDNVSPFSFFKWIVYNPNQFNEDELQQIITHEKIHAQHHHSIDIILSQLSTIIFWFNPITWLYKKDIEQNLEFIADYNAQNKLNCEKAYQHLLLKTSVPNFQMALTNNFYNSLIKKRIVMLHKSRSKKLNQLKYAIVLPALALFLMSFNTKEIVNYEKAETTTLNATLDNNYLNKTEIIVITKDMTDSELKELTAQYNKKGIKLKFSDIKRNNDNEIISIAITAKTKKSSANFNTHDDNEHISPITIKIDNESNSISIGNGHLKHKGNLHFVSKDGEHQVVEGHNGENVFVYSSDGKKHKGENVFLIKKGDTIHKKGTLTYVTKSDGDEKVFVTSGSGKTTWTQDDGEKVYIISGSDKTTWAQDDGAKVKLRTIGKGDKEHVVYLSKEDKDPLIIIDGKKSKKKMEDLDADSIESVTILKGEDATKKYGKKAKDGVVEVTTKKD